MMINRYTYKSNKKKTYPYNAYTKLIAYLLLLVLLFENCSHLQPAPMAIDTLPAEQVDKQVMQPRQISSTDEMELASFTSDQGFKINGAAAGDQSSWAVSGAGDVNGDGISDVIVSTYLANSRAGASYVIYGKKDGYPTDTDLARLDSIVGFAIYGAAAEDSSGVSVSDAGDVNKDGISDVIVGAYGANSVAGASYVIYGKRGGYASPIELASLNSTVGFTINGAVPGDNSGSSVSGAGDVNGDGIDDVIVGAPFVDSNELLRVGASYVIYGKEGGYASAINLASLDSTVGFKINGAAAGDQSGSSVSGAGDVNQDGIDDVIVGANQADPTGTNAGASYVIYGKKGGYASPIELASLNSTVGFAIHGAAVDDFSGNSVSGADDVNKDGIDDVMVGANGANNRAGASYVIYGKKDGYATPIELVSLNSTVGFAIHGAAAGDQAGRSVSGTGDVNKDGIDDVIIGAPGANSSAGASYVIYGKKDGYASPIELAGLDSTVGFSMHGAAAEDFSGSAVSGAGDVNQDGIGDVIVGATGTNNRAGTSYVIYGGHIPTAKSSASTPEMFWNQAAQLLKGISAWWNGHALQEADLNMDNPHIQALAKLKQECQTLIQEAPSVSKDKWYQFSLEDLLSDINEALKQNAGLGKEAVAEFSKRLRGIEKDFLEADPLQEQAVPYVIEKVDSQLTQPGFGMPALPMLPYQGASMLALSN